MTAALGGEAHLHCQLIETKDIRQVTWQKILTRGVRTVATIHKSHPHRVGPGYTDRVEFEGDELQNCTIVIRKVTEDDESCYYCLFSTYPEGAFTAKTCLRVYQLRGPILSVKESNSSDEAVVSCSATGRPTPTVTITIPQLKLHVSNKSSVSVPNNDSTVTVTETAVLSRLHANTTEVGCTVGVHPGLQRTESIMIPGIKQSSDEGFEEDVGPSVNGRSRAVLFVLPVFMTCCVLGGFLLWKQKRHSSPFQNILMVSRTPPTPVMNPHTAETSLQGGGEVRQRPSPKKNKEEDTPQ